MKEEVEILAKKVASYMSPQPGLILLVEPLLSQTIEMYAKKLGIRLTHHKVGLVKSILARAWKTHAQMYDAQSKTR